MADTDAGLLTGVAPLLVLDELSTDIETPSGPVHAVDRVSLNIAPGETLGVVGESGCGKTMMAMSIAGLLPPGGRVVHGSITLGGTDVLGLSEEASRAERAATIGVIFQNPMSALNPRLSVEAQLREALHPGLRRDRAAAGARCAELLDLVGVPSPWDRLSDYPHELSGGLAQRVVIALSLARDAKLLIADEPTTALDVSIQAQILDLIDDLKARLGLGVLLVTHDIGLIAERTEQVAVMYAGQVVEQGPTATVITSPRHRYTRGLIDSVPRVGRRSAARLKAIDGTPPELRHPPVGCRFAARCAHATPTCLDSPPPVTADSARHRFACWEPVSGAGEEPTGTPTAATERPLPVTDAGNGGHAEPIVELVDVSRQFVISRTILGLGSERTRHALSHVNLRVREGEALGIVGESGCGKSTLARLVAGLDRPSDGSVHYRGKDISGLGRARKAWRRAVQLIFQDPYSSLDPTQTIAAVIAEPLRYRTGKAPARAVVEQLIREVGLPAGVYDKRPAQLSGGQRQRVGIARALALDPSLIVADEAVSALDVSVQATILNLMKALQEQRSLTYLFISHDLGVVRYMCDRVAVMYLGTLVELAPTEELYGSPAHPYTAALLASVPGSARSGEPTLTGELPSAEAPPSGCRFRTRCPLATDRCADQAPPLHQISPTRSVACHYPLVGSAPQV